MAAQQFLTNAEFADQAMPSDAFSTQSAGTITAALVWASGIAGGYIAKRYKLPLVSWGEELRAAVGDLARWRLLTKIGVRPGSGNNEVARLGYEDAIAWLKQVSNGTVELDCVDSTPSLEEQGPLSESDDPLSFRFATGESDTTDGCCDDE